MAEPVPATDEGAQARVPAAHRGTTTIADRVVAKVASRVAHEVVSGAEERGRHFAGPPPSASVVVRSGDVRIRLRVQLAYPVNIGEVCGSLRREVGKRVNALTGMPVPEVVVQVEGLHPRGAADKRHGRVR